MWKNTTKEMSLSPDILTLSEFENVSMISGHFDLRKQIIL